MSVKDDMMKLVNKKAAQLKRLKKRQITSKSYVQDVIDFLNEVDQLSKTTLDEVTYYHDIRLSCQRLNEKLKTFDPFVTAEVQWHNNEGETDWRNFYAEGVVVNWSSEYVLLHPGTDPVEYIDYNRVLLEDL
jgi:hypothetical protein